MPSDHGIVVVSDSEHWQAHHENFESAKGHVRQFSKDGDIKTKGPERDTQTSRPPISAQHGRFSAVPSPADHTQSHPRPSRKQFRSTQPASERGSLEVRLADSSIHDGRNTRSATHTMESGPSHKRKNTDEMHDNTAVSHQHPRPNKQPFSPSSRGASTSVIETANLNQGRAHDDIASPVTTSPEIVSHGFYPKAVKASPESKQGRDAPVALYPASQSELESFKLVKEPITRPITEQQLINEVKGIYAGLVMVEKKCVEIVAQQSQSTKPLSDQQWKALVALHRTLLQEHHDFFSASQHPTASPTLKKLAVKYAMPARMWRHGIHAFLELLRHRLPDSMEHMLSFIYLAYSMMALLKESIPTFVETWIECLGDLARYRMAIEDTDARDREIWSNVAKMWYNEAADKSPNVGRIQHHLAVLARPNIVEQLFHYDKALVSVIPFINARESIMLLFDMFLKNSDAVQTRYPPTEYAFVNTYALLFTRRSLAECLPMLDLFRNSFGAHMDRTGARFKMQGPQMAAAAFAGLLDFGKEDSRLWTMCRRQLEEGDARKKAQEGPLEKALVSEAQLMHACHQEYWRGLKPDTHVDHIPPLSRMQDQEPLDSSEAVVAVAASLVYYGTTLVASRIGDKNVVPYMHVILANLWSLSFVPGALPYIETCIPWTAIIVFLNTIGQSGVSYANVESERFPPSYGESGRQLPEDFLMRGTLTTRQYYDPDFFNQPLVDEDDRTIELPSHQAPRAERCLYLGVRLATLSRYISYDYKTKKYDTTDYARSLNQYTFGGE